jgi:hypothetical protein
MREPTGWQNSQNLALRPRLTFQKMPNTMDIFLVLFPYQLVSVKSVGWGHWTKNRFPHNAWNNLRYTDFHFALQIPPLTTTNWWWWWGGGGGASQDCRGLIECCEEWVILPVARKWWRGLRDWSLGKTQYFVCKHCLSSDLFGVFVWYWKTYDVIHAHAGCKLTSSYVKLHSRGICVIFGSGSGGRGFCCGGGMLMYQCRADWRRRPWVPWLVVCIVNGIQQ